MASRIVTLNVGSSSVKFAVFEAISDSELRCVCSGLLDRIGLPSGSFYVQIGDESLRMLVDLPDFRAASSVLFDWLGKSFGSPPEAVGHRVVHGGSAYHSPVVVTPRVLEFLNTLIPFAPSHLPGEIAFMEAAISCWPKVPQVACFDTAFHASLPRVARMLPIPRRYADRGVMRYGFHGLSFSCLLEELTHLGAAHGRIILAHLGNGCSLAAVRDGRCMDTTMAFTPTAGLMMGTRTGDLDPGVIDYLLSVENLTPQQVHDLVNHQSGLLGVSGISSDLRDLLDREADDVRASEAVEMFCYQVRKWIGAFTAVLGGLDLLVFSGGIGENAATVRSRVCGGLAYCGLELNETANLHRADVISSPSSRVCVRVIPADEERMIARAVHRREWSH